jgi:hypothetical protein
VSFRVGEVVVDTQPEPTRSRLSGVGQQLAHIVHQPLNAQPLGFVLSKLKAADRERRWSRLLDLHGPLTDPLGARVIARWWQSSASS